jgi:hypothetical protein
VCRAPAAPQPTPPRGGEGEACNTNGTCDASNLACMSGTCQRMDMGGGEGGGGSCAVARMVHTTRCTDFFTGHETAFSACAAGCGASEDEAERAAAIILSQQTCLGSNAGCCEVEFDENFSVCGY